MLLFYLWVCTAVYILYNTLKKIYVAFSRVLIARRNGCKVPARISHADPLLGSDHVWKGYQHLSEHTYLEESRKYFLRYGNTYQSTMMAATVINTIEPENIKAILSTQFKNFGLGARRRNAFQPVLGYGIFATDGQQWRNSRNMIRPHFAQDQLANLEILERHTQHLISALPQKGSTVDLQKLFLRLTMDTATEIFFGESSSTLLQTETDSIQGFSGAFSRAQKMMVEDYALGMLSKLRPHSDYNRDVELLKDYIRPYVEAAIHLDSMNQQQDDNSKVKQERYILLRELVREGAYHVSDLTHELLNLVVAGRDTTASLLSSFWFVVARRPDVWDQLRQEVSALEGDQPERSQLKTMQYLRACLNETLRLYPPIPRNVRTALKDIILPTGGGPDGRSRIFVPAGTEVCYHVYAMHRRFDLWGPDALEFRPERWTDVEPGWSFLPFNGGPRICLGKQLALIEASYVCVRLIQRFSKVESRDPRPWQESLTLGCSLANGVQVALTPDSRKSCQ